VADTATARSTISTHPSTRYAIPSSRRGRHGWVFGGDRCCPLPWSGAWGRRRAGRSDRPSGSPGSPGPAVGSQGGPGRLSLVGNRTKAAYPWSSSCPEGPPSERAAEGRELRVSGISRRQEARSRGLEGLELSAGGQPLEILIGMEDRNAFAHARCRDQAVQCLTNRDSCASRLPVQAGGKTEIVE
jgi:hypothetical protein